MRSAFFIVFLLPLIVTAQKKGTLIIGPSFIHNKTLGSAIGGHIMAGPKLSEGVYLGFGIEAIKYQGVDQLYVPLTANLLLNPLKGKGSIAPIAHGSFGYGLYNQELANTGYSIKGGVYYGIFAGLKATTSKHHPYLMIGFSNPTFSGLKIINGETSFSQGEYNFPSINFRAGINLN